MREPVKKSRRAFLAYGASGIAASGKTKRPGGTIYMVSPDGCRAASTCLRRTGLN